jgi:hypothetical protein
MKLNHDLFTWNIMHYSYIASTYIISYLVIWQKHCGIILMWFTNFFIIKLHEFSACWHIPDVLIKVDLYFNLFLPIKHHLFYIIWPTFRYRNRRGQSLCFWRPWKIWPGCRYLIKELDPGLWHYLWFEDMTYFGKFIGVILASSDIINISINIISLSLSRFSHMSTILLNSQSCFREIGHYKKNMQLATWLQ